MNETYELWCKRATADKDLIPELESIKSDKDAISDAFYKELEFGTGGLRGVIGAGTNRMNVYTVGKATQGLSAYVNSITKNGSVAIAYDSRIKSDLFARVTAEVFAANGIKVYIYKELMPTPMLSFAVRYLKCDAGVVVTASHNPAKYNGYKAYDKTGCQLGPDAADYVLSIMNGIDVFDGVKKIDFNEGVKSGIIEYIGEDVIDAFLGEVKKCRVTKDTDLSSFNVVYTPLHGTGNKPVRRILDMIGIKNVKVVPTEELPNGNFPTLPFPNPEFKEAFDEALKISDGSTDLLLATDPDCDRAGIAVNTKDGFKLLTGNDVGALLLYYVLSVRKELKTLPDKPFAVKTIVSTELCKKIAADYGCELKDVLTGFKFIGEQISNLESKGEENRYVLGFEESYGYLAGTYARDKDAVVASMLICEMAAYYKTKGMNLVEVLNLIYEKYGYYFCAQKSFTLEGQSGIAKIGEMMQTLRRNPPKEIDGDKVLVFKDFKTSTETDLTTGNQKDIPLPKSNVLGFYLDGGSSFIVRPSGTEPKIKLYVSAVGKTAEDADKKRESLTNAGTHLLGI